MSPLISVIVPHYNDPVGLDLCLERLRAQNYPAADFEIIVADNASPQGEAEIARLINGRAKLVVVRERGAGPARNGGVAAAQGSIFAFTDADCQPDADWLAQGVKALESHDFVGGAMRVLTAEEGRMTPAEAFECVFAFDNEAYVQKKGFTVTANLFCPRKVFEQVGGFRVGVSEDVEWSLRAGTFGYRIGYAPGALVGHPARRTWSELQGKWKRINAETYALVLTGPQGRLRWLLKSLLVPWSALAHTPRVLTSPRLSSAEQRWSAMRMMYRLRMWRFFDALRLAS
jgi:glycosyltransferase involved in cell wall biosynthesis